MSREPEELEHLLESHLRVVPDFPKPGIGFRDITPLLADGAAFAAVIGALADRFHGRVDSVAGIEARGFVLAAPIAIRLGVGMVTVRKASKLPPPVLAEAYALEYGTASIEVSPQAVPIGARVLVVDDVLATGGTAAAGCRLLEAAGAHVEAVAFLLELTGLGGRDALPGREVFTVLSA